MYSDIKDRIVHLPHQLYNIVGEEVTEIDDDGDSNIHLLLLHQGSPRTLVATITRLANASQLDMQNKLGQSPLHIAAATKRYDCAILLLLWGANPAIQDTYGRTPLHIACELCDLKMIRILTCDIQQNREQLTIKPRYDVLRYDKQEHIGLINYEGESCLHISAKRHHLEAIIHLVRVCGLNVNLQERKNGRTILHTTVADAMIALESSTSKSHKCRRGSGKSHVEFLRNLLASELPIDMTVTTYDNYLAQDFIYLQPNLHELLLKHRT